MASSNDPATEVARSRVGKVLREKWHLDALLGVGGMAAVYAATHRNGKRVAVKILHPELSIDTGIRGRFLREGYVANKVGHPGAVSVSDDDVTDDGAVFIVMDLLEGEPLDARARRLGGRLDPREALSIADRLLDVLAAAHDKGILHRDIKPENIFVTVDGSVRLLDFGIARVRELSTASTATRPGSTMGTPAYMAPEQARGRWEMVDARTDLWAVGATMFSLIAGKFVHEAQTVNELLLAAMTKPAPPLRSVAPHVPDATCAVVDRALAFAPQDRWEDARSMQAAARDAYAVLVGAPIATAPKLTVPELEEAPTLQSGDYGQGKPASVTTAEPVSSGQTGAALGLARPRARTRRILMVGAAALLVGGVVVAMFVRGNAPASSGAGTTGAASDVVTMPAASASETPPPPEAASASIPASAATRPAASTPSATKPRATLPTVKPPPQVPSPTSGDDDPLNKRK